MALIATIISGAISAIGFIFPGIWRTMETSVMILTAYWCYSQCLHVVKLIWLNTIKRLSQVSNFRAGIKGSGQAGCLLSMQRGKFASPLSGLYLCTSKASSLTAMFSNWKLTVSVSCKNQRCFAINMDELQSQEIRCFCFKHLWIWEDQLS